MSQTVVKHGRVRGLKVVRPYTVYGTSSANTQTFKFGDLVTLVAAGTVGDMLAAGGESDANTKILGMALANAEDFYEGGPMYQRLCPVQIFTEDTEYLICLGTDADPALAVAWNADYVTTWASYGMDVTPTLLTIRRATASPYPYTLTVDSTNGMAIISNVVYNAIQNQGTNRGRPVVSDNFPDVWVRFPAARRLGA